MKNDNALTQRIIGKQPRVTTVSRSTNISFPKIKRRRKAKKATQAQIQILSPPVAKLVIEIKKTKNPAKRSLKNELKNI